MIVSGLNALFQLLSTLFNSIRSILVWLVDSGFYIFKAGVYFIFDGLLTSVVSIVGAVDVSTLIASTVGVWLGIPTQAIYCINALGLPQCLAMIGYSLTLRIVLNLIPSWATRV